MTDLIEEDFSKLVTRGWFRLTHFRLVIDAWPNARMRKVIGGKGWIVALIRQDERAT